jgi:hypothetical protein
MGVVERRGGSKGAEGSAAFAAEFELRRIGRTALRADPLQFGATLPAELLPFRVFSLTLRALHGMSPWMKNLS